MQSLKSLISEFKPALVLFYLSFMGCFCVYAVQMYMKIPFEPLICLCSMGIIFGIYTSNRFTDTAEDFTNDIHKAMFFESKRIYFVLAIASLAVSFGILLIKEKLNGLHFVLLGMGFCYSYRLIPWYFPGRGFALVRIKEMTFVKNLTVSFLWGASVFAVPILYSSAAVLNRFLLLQLGAGLFLSTLNNTLFDDILDEAGDRVALIKTLPTTWGSAKSYLLLYTLDGLWLAWVAGCAALGKINWPHAAFLAFLGAYPFVYMSMHRSGKIPKAMIDFLIESDLLFFAVGLLLLSLR